MNLLGAHQVSWDSVRRFAIECHALDSSAFSLLSDSILDNKTGKTKVAYEELRTEKLLSFAIALRIKFYQGASAKETEHYARDCGLLYKLSEGHEKGPNNFTFKDICDKIIHAEKIYKCIESTHDAKITTLHGTQSISGKKIDWQLSMSVTLFTEGVLNWIEKNEK